MIRSLIPVALVVLSVSFFAYSLYPILENSLFRSLAQYIQWMVSTREKMFSPLEASRAKWTILGSTAACFLLGFLLSHGYGWITFVFSVFFAWVGWSLPRFWLMAQWQKRLRTFDQQLVDALSLMSNSIKSGLNLSQVIQLVVEELPNPIAQEFGLVLSQQTLGLTIDEALEKMADRVPSEDLSVVIHSILILRETGGDLSETFDVISTTIRERRKVDGKIRAMTQQGKTQGLILFLMPPALAVLLYYLNPEFVTPLFTTRIGWLMILGMLFFQIIGGLWIRKIVTIDV